MKFISKPVIIEAMQLNNETFYECIDFIGPEKISQWDLRECWIDIVTPEGAMTASEGDWIIKGTEGEFYPCKDVVFKKKYVPVGKDEK